MKYSPIDGSLAVLLASSFIVACLSAPLQVVSLDGTCRGASQIGSYVSSQPISQTGNSCPVFGLIDCSSDGDGGGVFNSVLETSFEPNSRGMNLRFIMVPKLFLTLHYFCRTCHRVMFGY
jgi:hypothetical protein